MISNKDVKYINADGAMKFQVLLDNDDVLDLGWFPLEDGLIRSYRVDPGVGGYKYDVWIQRTKK